MRAGIVVLMGLFLGACSTGLQEVAFKDENGVFIVSRDLVSDRLTANQPHVTGVFACDYKMSAEAMAQWRQAHVGEEMSAYSQCQPIEKYRPGAYQLTSDQPVGTIYKGPIEAAILGAPIGAGLAMSGDNITQRGAGGTAIAGSSSSASITRGKRGHRR